MNERVVLKTEDGVSIVGDYYEGGTHRAVLLLHMMPATRASWTAFANALVADGFSAFAIDLRGHGESTEGPMGVLDYQSFTDPEHQATSKDVEAGISYLKDRGMQEIDIAGASIGANLAFVYVAGHPETKKVILFSPGLDYRGVKTDVVAGEFGPQTKIYFMVSKEDEYAAASTQELHDKVSAKKEIQIFDGAGHGTTILERKPEYLKILADWLTTP